MSRLADEALAVAHERVLGRWKDEASEKHRQLGRAVRTDPVYRPPKPSAVEKDFYEERRRCREELPRFRIRRGYAVRKNLATAEFHRVIEVEDTSRMVTHAGFLAEILQDNSDLPRDAETFIRTRVEQSGSDLVEWIRLKERGCGSIHRLPLSRAAIERATDALQVDEATLGQASNDLQAEIAKRFPRLLRQYGVDRSTENHVVTIVPQRVVTTALCRYSEEVISAVARAHCLTAQSSTRMDVVPLQIACSVAEHSEFEDTKAAPS